jgi:amino acid adenylation domain-containing protein
LAIVERQVRSTPHAPAVRCGDDTATYAHVWRGAEELARSLLELGVGPGRTAGLYAPRSIDLIVAILGILRAGAACVPLDTGYPVDRLRYMCADADVDVVVGHAELFARIGELRTLTGQGSLSVAGRPDRRPGVAVPGGPPAIRGEDLAYVVYTSGSTGTPKGVMYEHRNLANLITWQIADSACAAGERTLQFSPASFDIIFQETFTALGSGGTLVCCTEAERLDPGLLCDLIERERIERIFMPFVAVQALALFADEMSPERHPIREILTAGEQVQCGARIRALFERLPDCRLVNQWGTTETHVSTRYTLPKDVAGWPTLPPIGTAIAHSHVHVCDERGAPVPDGEVGELWVAGRCVGRGYLNLPERTAEGFVADPCDPRTPAYRTGDLGRLDDAGRLEFLGRRDSQVKVRGFRIELGEIETLLNSMPEVAEAVVAVMGGDDAADRFLQAFVVPAGPTPAVGEVLARLRGALPGYLVPSRLVTVSALPRTPSGKLDRLAVPNLGG